MSENISWWAINSVHRSLMVFTNGFVLMECYNTNMNTCCWILINHQNKDGLWITDPNNFMHYADVLLFKNYFRQKACSSCICICICIDCISTNCKHGCKALILLSFCDVCCNVIFSLSKGNQFWKLGKIFEKSGKLVSNILAFHFIPKKTTFIS